MYAPITVLAEVVKMPNIVAGHSSSPVPKVSVERRNGTSNVKDTHPNVNYPWEDTHEIKFPSAEGNN